MASALCFAVLLRLVEIDVNCRILERKAVRFPVHNEVLIFADVDRRNFNTVHDERRMCAGAAVRDQVRDLLFVEPDNDGRVSLNVEYDGVIPTGQGFDRDFKIIIICHYSTSTSAHRTRVTLSMLKGTGTVFSGSWYCLAGMMIFAT